jgi:hypothetical protein
MTDTASAGPTQLIAADEYDIALTAYEGSSRAE